MPCTAVVVLVAALSVALAACGGSSESAGGAQATLIWTGELFQLNIEAQRFLDGLGLNFFNDV